MRITLLAIAVVLLATIRDVQCFSNTSCTGILMYYRPAGMMRVVYDHNLRCIMLSATPSQENLDRGHHILLGRYNKWVVTDEQHPGFTLD